MGRLDLAKSTGSDFGLAIRHSSEGLVLSRDGGIGWTDWSRGECRRPELGFFLGFLVAPLSGSRGIRQIGLTKPQYEVSILHAQFP